MGGNIFSKSSYIKHAEVTPTVEKIFKTLGVSYKYALVGSTGKKEVSNDVDIAIEIPDEDIANFRKLLTDAYGEKGTKKLQKKMHSAIVPVEGSGRFIQVDFIIGDVDWYSTYYYHDPASKFKSAHRNIALSSVCAELDRKESIYLVDDERPLWEERWKWSPKDALVRVKRSLKRRNDDKGYCKKPIEELLSESTKDKAAISKILFNGTEKDILSLENIIEAIKRSQSTKVQEKMFARIAKNFRDNTILFAGNWDYPEEISKYKEKDDDRNV